MPRANHPLEYCVWNLTILEISEGKTNSFRSSTGEIIPGFYWFCNDTYTWEGPFESEQLAWEGRLRWLESDDEETESESE
jgi:hypothetical protein